MKKNWMDDHFKTGEPPKILKPEPDVDHGGRFWFFLFLLVITPIAAVGGAWWFGYLDPVIKEVVQVVHVSEPAPAPTAKPPNVNVTYAAKIREEPEPTAAPAVPTITRARANELQRLITSRESGIDLLTRDRAKANAKLVQAQNNLAEAKARLAKLERVKIAPADSARQYEWRIAHDDAITAAKNATNEIARQGDIVESFDRRIAKATDERDAAKSELAGVTIVDE